MKKLFALIIFLMLNLPSFAQEVVAKYDNSYGRYGLYNERTEQWVLKPTYEDMGRRGNYNGIYYFWFKDNTGLYGIIDHRGRVVNGRWQATSSSANGFFPVKQNGSWGLADIYGHIIIPCQYKDFSLYDTCAYATPWDGNTDIKWRMDQLVAARDKLLKEEKEAAEKARREKEQRIAREKKEKELASFKEYARAYVEPIVNQWQLKGEFEKLSAYQQRVTGPNRSAMIDSLTRIAEKKFIAEHAALKPENEPMTLDLYDSENEVFSMESKKLGKMMVQVPIDEAPSFKENFKSLVKKDAKFYIENDHIALGSLVFYNPALDKSYRYSNQNALAYNHYEIAPGTYTFNLVNVVTAKPAEATGGNLSTVPKRPTISILSPEKNSIYTEGKIVVRYQAKVFDGSTPRLHIWVNGVESKGTPVEHSGEKGVAAAWDEVELLVPKDKERPCNIMLSVTDDSGFSSENSTVSINYVGELPKPKLHLFSVGVSNYASPSLTKLGYAAKDAQDFVTTISSSDLSMYEQLVTPMVLTDATATRSNIEQNLARLTRDVEQDDVVMLFFSGHGVLDGEDAYFMSVDADGDAPYTGVDFSLIRKNMNKIKDKKCRVLVFMDACYSGAMFNTKSDLKTITFAQHDIIGFYSSTASQTSAEMATDQNGLFTKAALEGLKGRAKNKDGEITTLGLQKYISDYVSKQSKGKQSPIVENKQGDIVLYKVKK